MTCLFFHSFNLFFRPINTALRPSTGLRLGVGLRLGTHYAHARDYALAPEYALALVKMSTTLKGVIFFKPSKYHDMKGLIAKWGNLELQDTIRSLHSKRPA